MNEWNLQAQVEMGEFIAANTVAAVSRREAALGFLQTLVLKTLDVIDVRQTRAYGAIEIKRGPQWNLSFDDSVAAME